MHVAIVDDHPLFREVLCGVVQSWRDDVRVLQAGSQRELDQLLRVHGALPLVLLDLNLPDCDGLDLLERLRREQPLTSVVIMSAQHDTATVRRALEFGAAGFVPKASSADLLRAALALVHSGGVFIPPDALASPDTTKSPLDLGLTGRQLDVLALLMRGRSNKAIANALDLAEPTVKAHVSAIFRALGVSNRTEAALRVAQFGWRLDGQG